MDKGLVEEAGYWNHVVLGVEPWAGSGAGLCEAGPGVPHTYLKGPSPLLFPFLLLPGPQGSLSEAHLDIPGRLGRRGPAPPPARAPHVGTALFQTWTGQAHGSCRVMCSGEYPWGGRPERQRENQAPVPQEAA